MNESMRIYLRRRLRNFGSKHSSMNFQFSQKALCLPGPTQTFIFLSCFLVHSFKINSFSLPKINHLPCAIFHLTWPIRVAERNFFSVDAPCQAMRNKCGCSWGASNSLNSFSIMIVAISFLRSVLLFWGAKTECRAHICAVQLSSYAKISPINTKYLATVGLRLLFEIFLSTLSIRKCT